MKLNLTKERIVGLFFKHRERAKGFRCEPKGKELLDLILEGEGYVKDKEE